jgi:hypothetical protein
MGFVMEYAGNPSNGGLFVRGAQDLDFLEELEEVLPKLDESL